MNKLLLLFLLFAIFVACGKKENSNTGFGKSAKDGPKGADKTSSYDSSRGEGKFDKVDLAVKLNQAMAIEGERIAEVKCTSCHKPTEERLVGPGWKGVTSRKKPVWIMNFITNPDPMIDKDPEVQAQLEICLVRMPNQGLNDSEARNILEYMRKIDGVK
jgi:hypothetical protein